MHGRGAFGTGLVDTGQEREYDIEGADHANSNIHSIRDTLENINYDFTQEILRMNVSFLANEIGQASPLVERFVNP
jgi:hypothetical protein